MQSGNIVGSEKLVKTRLRDVRWQLELGGLSTLGRLGLEGLFGILVLQLIHQWIISTWRVAEKFFIEFFRFLFDNMSRYYLLFASLFPYSFSFILVVALLVVMAQRIISLICYHLLLFHTQINQSKRNHAVFLKLGV